MGPILFFSAMAIVRDSDFLIFLNVGAILGLSLLLVREVMKENIRSFTIVDYIITVVIYPLQFLVSGLVALGIMKKLNRTSSSRKWTKYLKGVLMAAPFLILFTALFMSADLMFKNFVDSTIHLSLPETTLPQIFLIGFISVAAFGVFAHTFGFITSTINSFIPRGKKIAGSTADESVQNISDITPNRAPDRTIESAVFLGLIATLFLIFIGFQVTYLFGGVVNIAQNGFTYAEYARKGFWELLVVALSTLLVLLAVDKYSSRAANRKLWFTFPSVVIILEVLVIIVSAFKRLMLYQSAYGMTTLRLYVSGTIILLGVIFIILLVKFVTNKTSAFFMFGVLLSLISALVVYNVINPDKLIVDNNIARYNRGEEIDTYYLSQLSTDAVPSLVNVYDKLSQDQKEEMYYLLHERKLDLQQSQHNWQSYNVSRVKALKDLSAKF